MYIEVFNEVDLLLYSIAIKMLLDNADILSILYYNSLVVQVLQTLPNYIKIELKMHIYNFQLAHNHITTFN